MCMLGNTADLNDPTTSKLFWDHEGSGSEY